MEKHIENSEYHSGLQSACVCVEKGCSHWRTKNGFAKNMVKEKHNSTRTYDLDGFRRRAACVCVKDSKEQEVLLVSGSRDPGVWIVPGGGIEPTEETSMAAIREVLEEAGVKGKLDRCLGVFDSADCRQRKWFTVAEARKHLGIHRPAHCRYLERLRPLEPAAPSIVSSS